MKALDFISGKDNFSQGKSYFNVLKYRELTTNPDFKKLFRPDTFIPLLWKSHNRLIIDKGSPIKIIKYFVSLRLTKRQMLYLLENLLLTFNRCLFPGLSLNENDEELELSLDFISIKCDKLINQLNTDIYNQCFLFDFTLIKKILKTIPNIFDQLKYLESIKTDFQQYETFHGLSRQTYFVACCDQEIRKLINILEYGKFRVDVSSPDPALASQFKSIDTIRNYISDKINSMDSLKWQYFCFSNADFYLLVSAFTDYFFSSHIDSGFKLILRPRCKTRLCIAVNHIYNRFSIIPLKNNAKFLALLQKLSVFNDQSPERIYNSVIRTRD